MSASALDTGDYLFCCGGTAKLPACNRIYRLYREEGLTVRKRHARRRAVGARAPILVETRANARWSLDFVHDQFACGRRFRILNLVDDVTRECLATIPDISISGRRVARELTTLIGLRGKPGMIVSDNGTEFTSNAMLAWAQESRITWLSTPERKCIGAHRVDLGRQSPRQLIVAALRGHRHAERLRQTGVTHGMVHHDRGEAMGTDCRHGIDRDLIVIPAGHRRPVAPC